MKNNRRTFINNSALGIFGLAALPNQLTFGNNFQKKLITKTDPKIVDRYPTTNPSDCQEVVGAAHTKFDKVKELVDARPELAKATFDWGFGDVESALGAASHMGRKDIAEYLIEKGARPNIFTFAMLGKVEVVKAMVKAMPSIQKTNGPHGLTLLFHAQMPLRREFLEGEDKERQEALVAYLEELGDANVWDPSLEISDEEKQNYLGIYTFGKGETEFFDLTLNSRNDLFLKRADYTGRMLKRVEEHIFAPGGAPSVKIHFEMENGVAKSFTIHDPTPILTAKKN